MASTVAIESELPETLKDYEQVHVNHNNDDDVQRPTLAENDCLLGKSGIPEFMEHEITIVIEPSPHMKTFHLECLGYIRKQCTTNGVFQLLIGAFSLFAFLLASTVLHNSLFQSLVTANVNDTISIATANNNLTTASSIHEDLAT